MRDTISNPGEIISDISQCNIVIGFSWNGRAKIIKNRDRDSKAITTKMAVALFRCMLGRITSVKFFDNAIDVEIEDAVHGVLQKYGINGLDHKILE